MEKLCHDEGLLIGILYSTILSSLNNAIVGSDGFWRES